MNFKIQYKPATTKEKPDTLLIEGCLNIHEMEAIKQEIERKLKEVKALRMQVQQVEQLDLSFLQFLIAFKNKYQQARQPLFIELTLKPEMEKLLAVSGFENVITANSY